MDFKILVEDKSGEKMLDFIFEKLVTINDTFDIKSFKGLGYLPVDLSSKNLNNLLLDNTLLNDLYPTVKSINETYPKSQIIIVCDIDNNERSVFYRQIKKVLDKYNPNLSIPICFAIEEGEAWLLGDIDAIKQAYPNAKDTYLKKYVNDSICGTWELLADAVYPGGSKKLSEKGWKIVGKEKSEWAENITPFMDVNINKSPSFNDFKNTVEKLIK